MNYLLFQNQNYDDIIFTTVIVDHNLSTEEIIDAMGDEFGDFVAIVDRIIGDTINFSDYIRKQYRDQKKRLRQLTKQIKSPNILKRKIIEDNKKIRDWEPIPPSYWELIPLSGCSMSNYRPSPKNFEDEYDAMKREEMLVKLNLKKLSEIIETFDI